MPATTLPCLYRASCDGWTTSNFHSCCDFKGPTVTVVKCEDNIFGGYTEESWESGKIIFKRIKLHRECCSLSDNSFFAAVRNVDQCFLLTSKSHILECVMYI